MLLTSDLALPPTVIGKEEAEFSAKLFRDPHFAYATVSDWATFTSRLLWWYSLLSSNRNIISSLKKRKERSYSRQYVRFLLLTTMCLLRSSSSWCQGPMWKRNGLLPPVLIHGSPYIVTEPAPLINASTSMDQIDVLCTAKRTMRKHTLFWHSTSQLSKNRWNIFCLISRWAANALEAQKGWKNIEYNSYVRRFLENIAILFFSLHHSNINPI